jgi:hypothetical protein
MLRRPDAQDQAKAAIARFYGSHGAMPTVAGFAKEMGYSSVAGAHYTLDKLVDCGFLTRSEEGGKLRPGPAFDWTHVGLRAAGFPQQLVEALPKDTPLRVVEVTEQFQPDDAIWEGDFLVLAPPERVDLSDVLVLRDGERLVFANEVTGSETVFGVVVGQFRSFSK